MTTDSVGILTVIYCQILAGNFYHFSFKESDQFVLQTNNNIHIYDCFIHLMIISNKLALC